MNKSIFHRIFEQIVDGNELVAALAEDKEFKRNLEDMAQKI